MMCVQENKASATMILWEPCSQAQKSVTGGKEKEPAKCRSKSKEARKKKRD